MLRDFHRRKWPRSIFSRSKAADYTLEAYKSSSFGDMLDVTGIGWWLSWTRREREHGESDTRAFSREGRLAEFWRKGFVKKEDMQVGRHGERILKEESYVEARPEGFASARFSSSQIDHLGTDALAGPLNSWAQMKRVYANTKSSVLIDSTHWEGVSGRFFLLRPMPRYFSRKQFIELKKSVNETWDE